MNQSKNRLTLPQTWCQPWDSSRLHPERRRGVRAAPSLSACTHGHYMALTHTLFYQCVHMEAGMYGWTLSTEKKELESLSSDDTEQEETRRKHFIMCFLHVMSLQCQTHTISHPENVDPNQHRRTIRSSAKFCKDAFMHPNKLKDSYSYNLLERV